MFWAVHEHRWSVVVPRCHALGHEADVLAVTNTRQAHEFEIKVSRADLLNDLKHKQDKYARMQDRGRAPKDEVDDDHGRRGANYFWYVVPEGLTVVDVAPPWAGIIELRPVDRKWRQLVCRVAVVREATQLHRARLPEARLWRVTQSACLRYIRAAVNNREL